MSVTLSLMPVEIQLGILEWIPPRSRVLSSMTCKLWGTMVDGTEIRKRMVAPFRFPNHELGLDELSLDSGGQELVSKLGFQPVSAEAVIRCINFSTPAYTTLVNEAASATYIHDEGYAGNSSIPIYAHLARALIVAPSAEDHTITVSYCSYTWKTFTKTWRVPKWHQYLWIPVDVRLDACHTTRVQSDVLYYVVYTEFLRPDLHDVNDWLSAQSQYETTSQ